MADFSSLDGLLVALRAAGCHSVYAKQLAANDNSKNQIYFGGGFQALNVVPYGDVSAARNSARAQFKAPVDLWWLTPDGNPERAPGAQLILYPQYPEVRFSGFLRGCIAAPSEVLTSRDHGRVLVLGVRSDGRVFAWAGMADAAVARQIDDQRQVGYARRVGVFLEIAFETAAGGAQIEVELLQKLGAIHRRGWMDPIRLRKDGSVVPCRGQNCGGFTLEAVLGVAANSLAEPDYLGYEVKQHAVKDFGRPSSGGAITLMTPEPTAGVYCEAGVESFVRAYGYADKLGRADRLNFGGVYRVGTRVTSTGLRMELLGWDRLQSKIVDAGGGIALLDDADTVAAMWHFTGLIRHWQRKHDRAVYVPSMKSDGVPVQYSYGDLVRLGEGADFALVLKALDSGLVYYDPGIKLEHVSTQPKLKRRSQFRVRSADIGGLYLAMRTVGVL